LVVAASAALLVSGGAARAVGLDTLSITAPADITVAATTVCGSTDCASVSFTFTVTGGVPPYHLVCTPSYSGDLFTVGSHTESCLAQDSAANSTNYAWFALTVTPGGPPPPPPPPPPATLAISPPADITAAATTPCLSTYCVPVSFTFTVTGGFPPYNLICNFYSGNLFTVGAHTVSCLAQDSRGNSTPEASFIVTITPVASSSGGGTGGGGGTGSGSGTGGSGGSSGGGTGGSGGGGTPPLAQDNTPPTIGEHADIVLPATTAAGAVATYSVAATDPDNAGTQLTISCQPASGSTFPLGQHASTKTTTVTCDTQDPAGNHAAPRTFTVTVRGAHSQITSLGNDVATTRTLTKHQEAVLVSTLIHAARQLKVGAAAGAISQLHAFVEQVRKLPPSHSQRRAIWITTATRIAAVMK
jgi:hypothetical protein